MHRLFLSDDELELRDVARHFAIAVHYKAPSDMLVKVNCVCPVDELTEIEGLDIFNDYVNAAHTDEYMYGIQLKVENPW